MFRQSTWTVVNVKVPAIQLLKRLAAVPLAWFLLTSPTLAVPPVRILPLGDSITYGMSVDGGYRWPLYQLLTNAGYTVDFTGTQMGNSVVGPPDPDHEGHPGWSIAQISSILPAVISQTVDPDVVLLLIGANDCINNWAVASATNRLDTLITKLTATWPGAKIVVSSLTPMVTAAYEQRSTNSYNPFIPGLVSNQAAGGRQVYFTDLHSALLFSDISSDNVHPLASGYNKMATNWFAAITNVIAPFGTTNAPTLLRVSASTSSNVLVTYSKPVDSNATNIANYAVSGGITVLAARVDPTGRRDATLTTSPLASNTTYTLTVSNVPDMTPAHTLIDPGTSLSFVANATPITIAKANNTLALDQTSSWVSNVVPGSTAIATWDSTVTNANTTLPGSDHRWLGMAIVNPAGNVVINDLAGSGVTNVVNCITLGAAGIDMSAATKNLTLTSSVVLDATQTWTVAAGRTLTVAANGIIGGKGGLMKDGAGTSTWAVACLYRGDTTINGGILKITTDDTLPDGAGFGNIILNTNGILDINSASDTINGLFGSGRITNAATGASTLTVGNNNVSSTFSGVIGNRGALSLVKSWLGTLTLSGTNNSYTGKTSIDFGGIAAQRLANAGLRSSLGAPTGTNAPIALGIGNFGGLLRYLGPGDSTDRAIELAATTGGAFLDASGTGPITFTSGFISSGAGSQTLTLQGSNADTNTISGVISNNSAANVLALTKTGVGTWILSGTNSYTGPTTITSGTLAINGSLAAQSSVTVTNAGRLAGTGVVNGTVAVCKGGTIAPAGTNRIDTLTSGSESWKSGGSYAFELADANGTAGGGYDQLAITGSLSILSTTAQCFTVHLISLAGTSPGPAANFINTNTYTWTLATASAGIDAFATNKFILNTNGFQNALNGGTFALRQSGNALQLAFLPPPAEATQVRVETAGDGSGSILAATNLTAGQTLVVYAVTRTAASDFVANVSADWSFASRNGGIADGDLISVDGKSAVLTARLTGTGTLHTAYPALASIDSGPVTVSAGSATCVRVETAADDSGSVLPAETLFTGASRTSYAVARDAYGNFIANIAASAWSLTDRSGAVSDNDLVASDDMKSATFTARKAGAATIHAATTSLTSIDSGLLTVIPATAGPGMGATFRNPVCAGGQDPWVVQWKGRYYYCFAFFNTIQIVTVDRLQDIGADLASGSWSTAWTAPAGMPYSEEIWAPELHYLDGAWYIYFAADDGANANHHMWVLKGSSPRGPFTLMGQLAATTDRWAIDGTVLTLDDGQHYFIWSGWQGTVNNTQSLYIAQMQTPTNLIGDRVLISRPTYDWEVHGTPRVNEGPEVLKKNGRTFVIYSASGAWTDYYCLGQLELVGTDPMDPSAWLKSTNAIFSQDATAGVYGPGHASFCKSPDLSQDWIVYHAAKSKGSGFDRDVRIQPFGWSEDGCPYFGQPLTTNALYEEPNGSPYGITYEAENADITGATVLPSATASRTNKVSALATNSQVTFHVNVALTGNYRLYVRYGGSTAGASHWVSANGGVPQAVTYAATAADIWRFQTNVLVALNSGLNTLTFTGGNGSAELDHIGVNPGPEGDINADGLPDAWQLSAFEDIRAPEASPSADADSDGADNAMEYQAGTNPTNGASVFRVVSVSNAPSARVIAFTSSSNRVYGLMYATNLLMSHPWSSAMPVTNGNANGIIQISDTNPVVPCFYRVGVQTP